MMTHFGINYYEEFEMSNIFFNIFPNENFIDLGMYQYGYEQCEPGHSFGPVTRNHYLFHYVISGTGTLMADNAKGSALGICMD